MTRLRQKKREKKILQGFLDTIGIRGPRLYSSEKPDFRFILKKEDVLDITGRIGVEITEHFNDATVNSNSSGQRLLSFWNECLHPEIIKIKKQDLANVHVYISFNRAKLTSSSLANPNHVKKIARQIVDFVRNEAKSLFSEEEKSIKNITMCPMIKQYVNSIRVSKCNAYFMNWDANLNASMMGINSQKIEQIIRSKSAKAQKYNLKQFKELWLLIAAPHDNSFNALRMTPMENNYKKIFDSDHIQNSCRESLFDRIFIWADRPDDKSRRWYYQIWFSKKK
jgi:hypothetical protein